jgi:lipoprotein-anchoring transpeptidase ErfK/SrfK
VVALLNAIEDGYRGEMEPVYLFSAMSHENQGIGYTYVEICISQQRMWCYQDGNLIVDTPVVTGNPNKGNATPSGGVWAIDTKQRDAILTGEGYTSPVDYWMPFNGNIGIHDMQTRAYFGGTIYLTNGSHGCINTPYDQAQLIYETVSVGTPVIVYD